MAHLNFKGPHSLTNLRKVAANRGGKILSIAGVRKGVLKDMGVKMADTRKIAEHIAATTHQLGKDLSSKRQILKTFREKWNLNEANSQRLLKEIAPEKSGPTKEQLEKRRKENILYTRVRRVGSIERLDFQKGEKKDRVAAKGKSVRDKLLKAHVPQSSFAQEQEGGQASALAIGEHSASGIADSHKGAAGIAKVIPLNVKDGRMKVKSIKGGTGFAGGAPEKGAASVISLDEERKKRLKQEKENENVEISEHHDDASHQIPFASNG